MKKFFLICLLIILPLQFSYAAVCGHCSNEQPVKSQKNQVVALSFDISGKSEPSGNDMQQCGCQGHCHLFGTVIFQASSTPLVLAEPNGITISDDKFYQSYISNDLERPNWRLAG